MGSATVFVTSKPVAPATFDIGIKGVIMFRGTSHRARTTFLAKVAAAALAAAPLVCAPARAQDAGNTGATSFFDTFDTFDRSRWSISNGWQNGDGQNCTWSSRNVRKSADSLLMVLDDTRTADRAYSCAEVQSRRSYGYGTYEIRMRAPAASGVITAFFSYTGPSHGAGRPHEQISFEFLENPESVLLNASAGGTGNNLAYANVGGDYTRRSNDYAFQWLPDRIRWYVNGQMVREVMATAQKPIPEYAARIIFSIRTITGDQEQWAGSFQFRGPLEAAVEHIAFTKAGAPCQFPTSVVCNQKRASN
jgi:endo-1,3-1,4-beta-glycanase ExoK